MMSRPASQKPGVGQVDADDLAELLGRPSSRPADSSSRYAGTNAVALGLVAGVHRQREQLAVRVGVHVARRVDEVRDVAPPVPVAVAEAHRRRPASRAAVSVPELAEPLDRQLALGAAGGVGHGPRTSTSPPGGTRWRSRPRGARPAAAGARPGRAPRSRRRPNVTVSPNTEAVSARVSGVSLLEDALGSRQLGVDAVAELVGERQHVAARRGPVQQQVRVVRRHGVGAERSPALGRRAPVRRSTARSRNCRTTSAISRGERAVGVEHDLAAVGPVELGRRRWRRWRSGPSRRGRSSPSISALAAYQRCGDGVAADHRLDQGRDRLVGRLVGEVPRRAPSSGSCRRRSSVALSARSVL